MWQTLGYPRVVETMDRALRHGRPAHAYLIVGPARVGKRRLAIDLAKAINCAGTNPPCGDCRSCDRIERGLQVDIESVGLLEEDGRRRKLIGLQQIQALQHQAHLAPFEGRYRVLIIDPADLLTSEAANCLLKTLEEPPERVVLILLANSAARILPTIVSRCQRIDLRPLPAEAIAGTLERRTGLFPDRGGEIARRARGRLGWALTAATDPEFESARRAAVAEAAGLAYLPLADRLVLVGRLATEFGKERQAVLDRLSIWLEWWRDVLLVALGCADLAVNRDWADELSRQATEFGQESVRQTIRCIETAAQQLNDNANARLALDVMFLSLPTSSYPPPVGRQAADQAADLPADA
ncbi:MAG TPA: DNA polymerase III subunit [Dehalococcoidia bacterium]|nr:DNA polymerase III subunit [Dehalococcoidia bacterium]